MGNNITETGHRAKPAAVSGAVVMRLRGSFTNKEKQLPAVCALSDEGGVACFRNKNRGLLHGALLIDGLWF